MKKILTHLRQAIVKVSYCSSCTESKPQLSKSIIYLPITKETTPEALKGDFEHVRKLVRQNENITIQVNLSKKANFSKREITQMFVDGAVPAKRYLIEQV